MNTKNSIAMILKSYKLFKQLQQIDSQSTEPATVTELNQLRAEWIDTVNRYRWRSAPIKNDSDVDRIGFYMNIVCELGDSQEVRFMHMAPAMTTEPALSALGGENPGAFLIEIPANLIELIEEEVSKLSATNTPSSSMPPFSNLSKRESEVLMLLCGGVLINEIAETSFVTVGTIRTQVKAVLKKLGVHSQVAAVSLAWDSGWVKKRKAERQSSGAKSQDHEVIQLPKAYHRASCTDANGADKLWDNPNFMNKQS